MKKQAAEVFVNVAVMAAIRHPLTYRIPDSLDVRAGQRVLVPLGNRRASGMVVEPVASTLRERLAALHGGALAGRLLDVDEVSGTTHVAGLIERPADVGTAKAVSHADSNYIDVTYGSNCVTTTDEAGKAHYRIEGYLPPEDFIAQLALGLGRYELSASAASAGGPACAVKEYAFARTTDRRLGQFRLRITPPRASIFPTQESAFSVSCSCSRTSSDERGSR